jgi:hypothetical protein
VVAVEPASTASSVLPTVSDYLRSQTCLVLHGGDASITIKSTLSAGDPIIYPQWTRAAIILPASCLSRRNLPETLDTMLVRHGTFYSDSFNLHGAKFNFRHRSKFSTCFKFTVVPGLPPVFDTERALHNQRQSIGRQSISSVSR